MALPPAAVLAQMANFLGAGIAGQVATQADVANAVAPLATQAQLATMQAQMLAQLAAMQAQLAAMQAQMQAQLAATQAQMQAQLIAQMQALLAPHNAPAIAAAATSTVQSIVASRMQNAHDRGGEAYAVVQRSDGAPPPHWPVGFDRTALVDGPVAVVDSLLLDVGPPQAQLSASGATRLRCTLALRACKGT